MPAADGKPDFILDLRGMPGGLFQETGSLPAHAGIAIALNPVIGRENAGIVLADLIEDRLVEAREHGYAQNPDLGVDARARRPLAARDGQRVVKKQPPLTASEFVSSYNATMTAKTGDAGLDHATAGMRIHLHGKVARWASAGLLK